MANSVYLILTDTNGQKWQITYDGLGGLLSSITFTRNQAANLVLTSPGGVGWQVVVSTLGIVSTVAAQPAGQTSFIFGPWALVVADDGILSTTQLACPSYGAVYVQDESSALWQLSVISGGILQSTSVSPTAGNPTTIVLRDANNATWLLGITTGGFLTTTSLGTPLVGVMVYNGFPIPSSCCDFGYFIGVNVYGLLTTTFIPSWPSPWYVGQLFPTDNGYPNPQQPLGIGTAVTVPTQTINEHTGRFYPGCGHSINSYSINSVTICSGNAALITCPLCGYIQNIVSPFSQIYTLPYQYIWG